MDEDEIRDFLLSNPDYFQKNPAMLDLLQIPHSTGGAAVSLVERQVSVLRDRNVDLRHRLRDLGNTAKDNDQLFADTREMILALIPTNSISELLDAVLKVLRENFGLEYASVSLFEEAFGEDAGDRTLSEAQAKGKLNALLGHREAGCGALRADEFAYLFPGEKIVGSAAIALIKHNDRNLGLLAVGNSNAGYYDSDMGTLFLEFIAEVLGLMLARLEQE